MFLMSAYFGSYIIVAYFGPMMADLKFGLKSEVESLAANHCLALARSAGFEWHRPWYTGRNMAQELIMENHMEKKLEHEMAAVFT